MGEHFVFLEIADPEIDALFRTIRREIGMPDDHKAIHITIRGPFSDTCDPGELERLEEKLRNSELVIANTGLFENQSRIAVYYAVACDDLRHVWHKPDYPINKFGFNPHITVYEGTDKEFATELRAFLDRNRIELICRDFDLTFYLRKQLDLFPNIRRDSKQFLNLIRHGKVNPMFHDRLSRFVNAYRKRKEQEVESAATRQDRLP